MLLQKTIGGTMTSTSAEAAPGRAGMVGRASGRLHPLFALLLLALAIRVAAAVWPNVIYPDEVFQYLEPAWRIKLLGRPMPRARCRDWRAPSPTPCARRCARRGC